MNECMIDIETLDVARSAVVLQVGVVIWDSDQTAQLRNRLIYQRNFNLDVDRQIRNGRTIKFDTLKFWMGQPDGPRNSVMADDHVAGYEEIAPTSRWSPGLFFGSLVWVIQKHGANAYWAKGTFDFDILESLAEDMEWKGDLPWSFRTKRDLRTALDFDPLAKKLDREPGLEHTGMDDCIHQIQQLEFVRRSVSR